jgi:hypothetical protein
MKTFKSDLAPVGFYFDLIPTEIFKIPVLPIPMRIDKIFVGESTFLIFPDTAELVRLREKLDLAVDVKLFLLAGIKNLINFAKIKYKEKMSLELSRQLIIRWFEYSLNQKAEIPSFIKDFTYLTSEFLKFYDHCEKNDLFDLKVEKHDETIFKYCEKVISYFKDRIESNEIQTVIKNNVETFPLYKEKKNKYHPEIIPTDVINVKNNKIKTMNFVPYLIYDDMIDVFSYNKKILLEDPNTKISLKMWKDNRIINKGSFIKEDIINKSVINFKLKPSDLESLL